jgi:hypothetical protein
MTQAFNLALFANNLNTSGQVSASGIQSGVIPAAEIPVGTVMLFYQSAAPTGWTQVTTQNNKALRVVSGTGAGTGGSVAFTTAFASQAVSGTVGTSGATTLSTAQMPSHAHNTNIQNRQNCGGGASVSACGNGTYIDTSGQGSGGSHTHGGGTFTGTAINLAVQYIDVIIASKN